MEPRRSTRLNVIISGVAPPPRGSTMAITVVATTVATYSEVHGVTTTAQVVSSKLAMPFKAHGTKAMAQAVSLQA
ncbi:hypothetical protein TB2_034530 [Malus domestica]